MKKPNVQPPKPGQSGTTPTANPTDSKKPEPGQPGTTSNFRLGGPTSSH